MLILLIVMLSLCKHVLFYWVGHGNLIKKSVHHGSTNQYTLVNNDKKIALLPMFPEQILKDDIARASKAKK